jgi:NAD(P)H-dependent FMN reductase
VIFRATGVELGDDDTAKVTGELTMRGVACSITAVWAQAELRKVLKTIGADVLDAELPVPTAHAAFCNGGGLCDPELAVTLRSNVHRLVGQTLRQAA